MKEKTKFIRSDRRSFLKGAAVAGGTAAVAPSVTLASDKPAVVNPVIEGDKGYEENDYIRNYYERARF